MVKGNGGTEGWSHKIDGGCIDRWIYSFLLEDRDAFSHDPPFSLVRLHPPPAAGTKQTDWQHKYRLFIPPSVLAVMLRHSHCPKPNESADVMLEILKLPLRVYGSCVCCCSAFIPDI